MAVLVVGICGATCSGKTSLAQHLQKEFPHTVLINQDRFYLDEALLPQCSNGTYNWDVPESLNQSALLHMVQEACNQPRALCQQCPAQKRDTKSSGEMQTHIVVIEGTMILAIDKLSSYLDTSFFLALDEATCRQRRGFCCRERKYAGAPDPPGYFDQFVWPSYKKMRSSCHVQNAGIYCSVV
jgi:nicotinamide/nicotinate riboside kinase